MAERLGLDRKIFEFWQKSKVSNGKDPNGTEIFRDSYKENLEAARNLEQYEPRSARKLFDEFGIANFSRYDKGMLLRQLKMIGADVPYGVVVFSEADHNGAFAQNSNSLAKMTNELNLGGLEVRIIEVASQLEMARRLSDFNKRYGGENGHKINFLIIGGHGTSGSVKLGERKITPPPARGSLPESEYRIALAEWQEQQARGDSLRRTMVMEDLQTGSGAGIRRASERWFEKEAPVIFISCSTGAEGGIAQKTSKELSFDTIAPNRRTNIQSIDVTFDSPGKPVFKIEYFSKDKETRAMRYNAGQKVEQV